MRRRMTEAQYRAARAAAIWALDATGVRSLPLAVAAAALPDVPEWDDYVTARRAPRPNYQVATVRFDPDRGSIHGTVRLPFRASFADAVRAADAQDTRALVCDRGTIYHDNGKPEAGWTAEQIKAYDDSPLRTMTPAAKARLAALNDAMTGALLGGARRPKSRRKPC